MDRKTTLEYMSKRLGADLFGVASASDLNDAPGGHRPLDILSDAKSVIVLGLKMLDAQIDILPSDGDYFGISPRQSMLKGHNSFISQELDRVGYALARALEKEGMKAYHQLASTGGTDERYLIGLLSLKHMAVRAGLGVLGYSSLLLTPEFGPRVRLTAIVTDAEIQPDTPVKKTFCANCENPCISSCPAKALQKPTSHRAYEINKYACRQYLTTRPICSLCLKVCPVGSKRMR